MQSNVRSPLPLILVILSAIFLAFMGIYDLPLIYYIYNYYHESLTVLAIVQVIISIGSVITLLTVTAILDFIGPFRSYFSYMVLGSFSFLFLSLLLPALGIYNPTVILFLILSGIVYSAFSTLLNTILPAIYSKEQLVRANSIFWAVRHALGALLLVTGYMIDVIGSINTLILLGAMISITAASAAAIDIGVMRIINPSPLSVDSMGEERSLNLRYLVEGAYYLYKNRAVLRLIIYATIVSIPISVISSIYPVAIARALFGGGAFFLGLISALGAVMASAGSLAVARIYGRFVKGKEILFMIISIISMGLLSLTLSTLIIMKSQIIALLILLLMSFVSLMYEVILSYVSQTVIPGNVRARIFGIRWTIEYISFVAGSIVSARLADIIGVDLAIAILSTLFFITGFVSSLDRGFRKLL